MSGIRRKIFKGAKLMGEKPQARSVPPPFIIETEGGTPLCNVRPHTAGYFYLSELLQLKDLVDRTIKFYLETGLTDDWVDKHRRDRIIYLETYAKKRLSQAQLGGYTTFVYLIFDESTGYYKIGKSANPGHRERTLQAEKPTLRLVEVYGAVSWDEYALHNKFQHRRVRGEWFLLDDEDLNEIGAYFAERGAHGSIA